MVFHVAALLNGMPSLKTVDIGEAATAYSYTPYVADAADIARLAEVPADLSMITSFAYNCDAPFSFQTSQAGNTVHRYRPLLNDMFFERAILPRVRHLTACKVVHFVPHLINPVYNSSPRRVHILNRLHWYLLMVSLAI